MGIKIIAKNKRAGYDYTLDEKFEAGIELRGTEVKSLRIGKVSMNQAYVTVDNNLEAWVYNINIPQYEFGNIHNHEEGRKRKLLLHKKQLHHIFHKLKAERMTMVPTKLYFKNSHVKLEFALGKGKRKHDKRHDKAKKDVERRLKKGDYNI